VTAMRAAVFLDRDGTMIHDVGYLNRVEDLRWYASTIDAVRLLNRAGFLVFVTTNQAGIGLGLLDDAILERLHGEMTRVLDAEGARVDGWFHCPHHPRAVVETLRVECGCRKPQPGMVHQAQARFAIDLQRSFVVGDKMADVGLAASVGARGVLVRTGYGDDVVRQQGGTVPEAAFVAANLMEATSWILAGQAGSR
jgi:D-glycero-D-manno-heptose 1,7-bisphosphate phosphatase